MDTKKLAADLVQKVGGKGNISNVTHCVTRLRFVVKDAAKVDADGIKGLDGVLDLVLSSGQHQVVIGPKVPAALTSRSASSDVAFLSLAFCAALPKSSF